MNAEDVNTLSQLINLKSCKFNYAYIEAGYAAKYYKDKDIEEVRCQEMANELSDFIVEKKKCAITSNFTADNSCERSITLFVFTQVEFVELLISLDKKY